MKICFKCKKERPLTDYYKHSQMKDGHVNKCIECNKKDVSSNYYEKIKSIDFVEKERARCREKYKRLDYKKRSKDTNKNKPWANSQKYKNLNRKFKIPKGFQLHHWSYNENDIEDVIILKTKEHRQAHLVLKLDYELRKFKTLEGVILETKQSHINYLIQKNIMF